MLSFRKSRDFLVVLTSLGISTTRIRSFSSSYYSSSTLCSLPIRRILLAHPGQGLVDGSRATGWGCYGGDSRSDETDKARLDDLYLRARRDSRFLTSSKYMDLYRPVIYSIYIYKHTHVTYIYMYSIPIYSWPIWAFLGYHTILFLWPGCLLYRVQCSMHGVYATRLSRIVKSYVALL